MNNKILDLINSFSDENISIVRKIILKPLIEYIQTSKDNNLSIRLNFICTHNSRRSILSQIWAQTMAYNFKINNVNCYSGGSELTSIYPAITDVLSKQGFNIIKIVEGINPVYGIKFDLNGLPIIAFSKIYSDNFNPKSDFVAIMTCDNADNNCPVVYGAVRRFSVKYEDPKIYDNTDLMLFKYEERSLEIAQEMWWVFSQIR